MLVGSGLEGKLGNEVEEREVGRTKIAEVMFERNVDRVFAYDLGVVKPE